MSIVTDRIGIATPRAHADLIVARVAVAHRSTYAEVMGRRRVRPIINARHAAIVAIMQAYPHWSYTMIARVFGLDHTTVINALQRSGVWTPRIKGNMYHKNLAAQRERQAGTTQTNEDQHEHL